MTPNHHDDDFRDASTTPIRALDGALAAVVAAARAGLLIESPARTFLSTLTDLGYGLTLQQLADPFDPTVTDVDRALRTLTAGGDTATTIAEPEPTPAKPVVTDAPAAPWSVEGIRNRGVVLRFTGTDGLYGLRRGHNYQVVATEGADHLVRMTEPASHVYGMALMFWNEWSVAE